LIRERRWQRCWVAAEDIRARVRPECELAQSFRRLGSEVDLVSATPRDEPAAGEMIRRRFEQDGLRCRR
jgi:hypothetical protein